MNIKTLSVIALVSAAVSTPAFAQDVDKAVSHKPVHVLRHYRNTYNQVQGPGFVAPQVRDGWNAERDIDPSRVGGRDPDFNPAP